MQIQKWIDARDTYKSQHCCENVTGSIEPYVPLLKRVIEVMPDNFTRPLGDPIPPSENLRRRLLRASIMNTDPLSYQKWSFFQIFQDIDEDQPTIIHSIQHIPYFQTPEVTYNYPAYVSISMKQRKLHYDPRA